MDSHPKSFPEARPLPTSLAFPPSSPTLPTHSGLPVAPRQARCSPPNPHLCVRYSGLSVSSAQLADNSPTRLSSYAASIPLPTEIKQDPVPLLSFTISPPLCCFTFHMSQANRRFCLSSVSILGKISPRVYCCGHKTQQRPRTWACAATTVEGVAARWSIARL